MQLVSYVAMAFAALFAVLSGSVFAQPVLITSDTQVGPFDTTIGGIPLATAEVTVDGATLTYSSSDLPPRT